MSKSTPGFVIQTVLDRFAVMLSALCFLHCLITPVLLIAFPMLAIGIMADEHAFHSWMLWLVLPVSVVAFTIGFRRHRRLQVLWIGAIGLVMIFFANTIAHDIGLWAERFGTLFAAIVLAFAHLRNYQLVGQFTPTAAESA